MLSIFVLYLSLYIIVVRYPSLYDIHRCTLSIVVHMLSIFVHYLSLYITVVCYPSFYDIHRCTVSIGVWYSSLYVIHRCTIFIVVRYPSLYDLHRCKDIYRCTIFIVVRYPSCDSVRRLFFLLIVKAAKYYTRLEHALNPPRTARGLFSFLLYPVRSGQTVRQSSECAERLAWMQDSDRLPCTPDSLKKSVALAFMQSAGSKRFHRSLHVFHGARAVVLFSCFSTAALSTPLLTVVVNGLRMKSASQTSGDTGSHIFGHFWLFRKSGQ